MARILRPRTFFAALVSVTIFVIISALALLPREPHLFPLSHLPRLIVAAETLVALLFFPLLIYRFRDQNRFSALLIDSLMVFAVSIPFVVLSALITSLNLWAAIVSQLLYLAMLFLGASLVSHVRSRLGVSVYLLTVFLLIAAIPLTGELIAQFAFPLNLSAISPINISMQTVVQRSVPLPAVAVICICIAVAGLLWGTTALRREEDKTL